MVTKVSGLADGCTMEVNTEQNCLVEKIVRSISSRDTNHECIAWQQFNKAKEDLGHDKSVVGEKIVVAANFC